MSYDNTNARVDPRRVVVDNDAGQEETWRLEGECNQCGECCRGFQWTEWVSPQIPVIDGVCAAARFRKDATDEDRCDCSVYEARPWDCAIFPSLPSYPLPERCGYRWVKEDGK